MKHIRGRARVYAIAAVIAAALLGAAVLGRTPSVFAETNEYPYGAMPCAWAPYAATGTTARWCKNYDWGKIRGNTTAASVISPYGYYYRNCTDYAAWKVSTLGVAPGQYKGLGNAKEWAVRALSHGLRVDGTPAVGSVAVRTSGTFGHTAFVEAVNPAGFPAGTIKVSQYNYHADGNYTEKYDSPASFGFTAFVHFEDYERKSEPPPAIAVTAALTVQPPPASEPLALPTPDPETTPPTVESPPAADGTQVGAEGAMPEQIVLPVEAAVGELPIITAAAEDVAGQSAVQAIALEAAVPASEITETAAAAAMTRESPPPSTAADLTVVQLPATHSSPPPVVPAVLSKASVDQPSPMAAESTHTGTLQIAEAPVAIPVPFLYEQSAALLGNRGDGDAARAWDSWPFYAVVAVVLAEQLSYRQLFRFFRLALVRNPRPGQGRGSG